MRNRCCSCDNWSPSEGIVLTEEALNIIRQTDKNIAIIAGPGAGKTELLAQKANFLLQTGLCPHPQKILALCFKVDAAANIEERVKKRCSSVLASRFKSLTFDSFFHSIIRRFSVFLPEWLNSISEDFDVTSFDKSWWQIYKKKILNSQDNPFESTFTNPYNHSPLDLNGISDPRLIQIWQYCVKQNIFDYNMCRSMAYTIIKNSVEVRKLISSTYKYVFLDEFQDTTEHQYLFIRELFQNTGTIITAVGDTNQMIMGWAGADIENFKNFSEDFNAEKHSLLINHRSNKSIINLINFVISKITYENDEKTIYIGTRQDKSPENSIMAASFVDIQGEVSAIANYIKFLMKNDPNLRPCDFALILRQKASDFFNIANREFLGKNIGLRNEDEIADPQGIKVQDLMDEPLSKFFINLIRKKENLITPEQKKELIGTMISMESYDLTNERSYKKMLDKLNVLAELINFTVPVSEWTNKIITKVGREKIRNMKLSYRSPEFIKVKISFDALFQECLKDSPNINKAIISYEGQDQVKLMTIHKSKGLEFNTVFFVDFNNSSWWGLEKAYKNQDSTKIQEEINNFFVGLSRARERLIFTNVNNEWPFLITDLLRESKMVADFQIYSLK